MDDSNVQLSSLLDDAGGIPPHVKELLEKAGKRIISVCSSQEQADKILNQADKECNPVIVSLSDLTELYSKHTDAHIDVDLIAPGSAQLCNPNQFITNTNSQDCDSSSKVHSSLPQHTRFLNRHTCETAANVVIRKFYLALR